ncbi:hypothetical protein [Mycolicibacterium sp. XJ870]
MIMRWLYLFIAVAVLAGCTPGRELESATSPQNDQQYPNWPTLLNEFRFHWTAAPGIDLNTGPAVAVRAYNESYEVANMTFDIQNVYPGFLRATPENQPREGDYSEELIGIRPLWVYARSEPPKGVQHFGFNSNHLLQITPIDDGYSAIVCTGWYSNVIKSVARPDAYISVSSRETRDGVTPESSGIDSGVSVRRIDFTQHDPRVPVDGPAPVSGPQRGPAPAPQIDVFGNWFVTASSTWGWGPLSRPNTKNFPTPELVQRCSDAMPDNESQRREMMTGYKDQPPLHGDAVPGWPLQAG